MKNLLRVFRHKDSSKTSSTQSSDIQGPFQRKHAVFNASQNNADAGKPLAIQNQDQSVLVPEKYKKSPIFGTPLQDSLQYASVKISLTDHNGNKFVYGYIPVIIAKCSAYLKYSACDVEGIFRLSGSTLRTRELQQIFNTPPSFGREINWEDYTVHDAANVLRRYMTSLPEPVIPLASYEAFREPVLKYFDILEHLKAQAARLQPSNLMKPDNGQNDPMPPEPKPEHVELAVQQYEKLIFELSPIQMQLLVYMLDLLAVFAAHSSVNRMSAYNLAAIFQPSILAHPEHERVPEEFEISRIALEFLIMHSAEILEHVEKFAIEKHEQAVNATK